MISSSAKWHIDRRKAILKKYPEISSFPKYNPYALISIILIPVVQFFTAYFCQYIPTYLGGGGD